MVNIINLNYTYNGNTLSVLSKIKSVGKGLLKDKVGSTKDGDVLKFTYFSDYSEITFHLASESHISVRTPSHRLNDAKYVCSRLEREKIITKIHEKEGSLKSTKQHERAYDVLMKNMQSPDFAEYILVLPSALEEAKTCEFEYDSPLDTNLKKLVAFAKLKRNPEYAKTLDEHLALNHAGLGHFAHAISQTARLNFPEDYTADYKGKSRIFEMHITIGKNFNPKTCMSIYMDWDPVIQKLVIARFGRHGRGADDK